nr:hypothetical protein C5F59_11635 [Streptomyces sp. QL37]
MAIRRPPAAEPATYPRRHDRARSKATGHPRPHPHRRRRPHRTRRPLPGRPPLAARPDGRHRPVHRAARVGTRRALRPAPLVRTR